MTERFRIADYPTDIEDTLTGKKYAVSSYEPHMVIICELLNKFYEENKRLREENEILEGENIDLNEELMQLDSFKRLLESKGIDL